MIGKKEKLSPEAKQGLKELIYLWREILQEQPELKERIRQDIVARDNELDMPKGL